VVTMNELRGVHEHATRTTSRIKNRPVVRLDHLDNQFDDGGWRKILTALLHE
jgi:hypothetical protein